MSGTLRARLAGAWPLLLFGLGLLAGGCEEDVLAVLPGDRVFTLYGLLAPQADTQWVRVFPIEERFRRSPPGPIDARVTSTDLATGETHLWRDSLIQEPDGFYAHLFYRVFRPEYGRAYRVEAARAGGERSYAEVAVPPRVEIEVGPAAPEDPLTIPFHVRGPAPRLMRLEMHYLVRYGPAPVSTIWLAASYDRRQRPEPGGWIIPAQLRLDYLWIVQTLTRLGVYQEQIGVGLEEARFRLAVVNEEWDPAGGSLDSLVLAQERTLLNVRNGFGFVGAGYRLETPWMPTAEQLEMAGFRTVQGAAPASGPGR